MHPSPIYGLYSTGNSDTICGAYLRIVDTHVATIRPGLDLRRFQNWSETRPKAREALGVADDGLLVGWVGRLVPIKDCATFIRACAIVVESLPQTQIIIAGDGPLREECEVLARELGVPVRFLGNRSDVPALMAAMDVFVLSSANEGFGRVLVEAMASAAPIVATAVGGVPEVVQDGQCGLLAPPGDPKALAAAIRRVLSEPKLSAAFAERGLQRAPEFSIERTVQDIDRIYERVLSGSCAE